MSSLKLSNSDSDSAALCARMWGHKQAGIVLKSDILSEFGECSPTLPITLK